jgi:hypothetical protein
VACGPSGRRQALPRCGPGHARRQRQVIGVVDRGDDRRCGPPGDTGETDPDHGPTLSSNDRRGSDQSTAGLIWATAITFLAGDQAATLEFGRQVIRALQQGGDRRRMGLNLHWIAGTLAATRPEAATCLSRYGRLPGLIRRS